MKMMLPFVVLILLLFNACGSSSSDYDENSNEQVKTIYGLGECDEANEGVTKFVISENEPFTCVKGDWKTSEKKGDSSNTAILSSSAEMPDTNETDGLSSSRSLSSSSSEHLENDNEIRKGTISIDENEKMFEMFFQKEVCVNENAGYVWETKELNNYRKYKYDFIGDTLVLYSCNDSDCDRYGYMLVGGSAGDLNGTWNAALCDYDSEEKKTSCQRVCDEDFINEQTPVDKSGCAAENAIYYVTITISGTSFTYRDSDDYIEYDVFDDYMNSEFMSELYGNLEQGYADAPSINYLVHEDYEGVEKRKRQAEIDVLEQTKNSVVFKYGNQEISVNVEEVLRTKKMSRTSMTIKSSTANCSYWGESGVVTKNTCKAEYGEFFTKQHTTDMRGSKVVLAIDYSKSNKDEFQDCVESLMESLFAAEGKTKPCSSEYEAYIDCVYAGLDNCSRYLEEYYQCIADSYQEE